MNSNELGSAHDIVDTQANIQTTGVALWLALPQTLQ